MLFALYIGFYKNGKFNHDNWKVVTNWLAKSCNNVLLYSNLSLPHVSKSNLEFLEIESNVFSDETTDYKGYRIKFKNDKILSYLEELIFNIHLGVSHVYFLYNDICVGELVVVDYEHFVILNISEDETEGLSNLVPDIEHNIAICNKHKSDIESIIGDKMWYPLRHKT